MLLTKTQVYGDIYYCRSGSKCGEAGNTTVIGTQLYFTSCCASFLAGTKNVFCTFASSDVSNDEAKYSNDR